MVDVWNDFSFQIQFDLCKLAKTMYVRYNVQCAYYKDFLVDIRQTYGLIITKEKGILVQMHVLI